MDTKGGGNYRIDKNVSSEKQEYTKNKGFDTDNNGNISLLEYLDGISKANPSYPRPTQKDKKIAKNIDLLLNGNFERKFDAAAFLWKIREKPLISIFIKALENGGVIKTLIARALVQFGRQAVPRLILALSYTNIRIRGAAAEILGKIGDKKALPQLKNIALWDQDQFVRGDAIIALGRLGTTKEVNIITGILQNDREQYLREMAVLALGQMKKFANAQKALIKTLNNPRENNHVRAAAALSLIGTTNPKAIHALFRASADSDYFVQSNAHRAFYVTLKDKNNLVRRSAVLAIARYINWHMVNKTVRNVGGITADSQQVAMLIGLYYEKIETTRSLKALLPTLRKLSTNDPDPIVRKVVQHIISKIEKSPVK